MPGPAFPPAPGYGPKQSALDLSMNVVCRRFSRGGLYRGVRDPGVSLGEAMQWAQRSRVGSACGLGRRFSGSRSGLACGGGRTARVCADAPVQVCRCVSTGLRRFDVFHVRVRWVSCVDGDGPAPAETGWRGECRRVEPKKSAARVVPGSARKTRVSWCDLPGCGSGWVSRWLVRNYLGSGGRTHRVTRVGVRGRRGSVRQRACRPSSDRPRTGRSAQSHQAAMHTGCTTSDSSCVAWWCS